MSMPNIPDITSKIDITFEDSVNLLLTSIAKEEISLSKLMDAEKDKISFVLHEYQNNDANIESIIDINESVNKTIKNLIKMQMLLQFKLEDVNKLIPQTCTCTCTCTCKCTSTPNCCIKGKSKGMVSNKSDEFYSQDVTLSASISSCNCMDNIIHYHVGNNRYNFLFMKAENNDIKVECSTEHNEIKISGKGKLERILECNNTYKEINFELLLYTADERIKGFKMIIQECENQAVIHDSGLVKVCCCSNCCKTGLKLIAK